MSEQLSSAHKRLVDAREAKRQRTWVESRIADANGERETAAHQLEATRLRLEVEKDDVDDLEGSVMSKLSRLFSSSSRDDLERERKDLAAAKLAFDEAEAEVAAIDADLAQLLERQQALASADTELAAAASAVEVLVRDSDPEWAGQLDGLADREAWLRNQLQQIIEASQVGGAVDVALGVIMDELKKARKTEIGTGIASNLVNDLASEIAIESVSHIVLNNIRQNVGLVRHDLIRFQQECRDVSEDSPVEGVELQPMPGVLDFIVADLMGWHVLEVIHDVSWRIEKTRDQVQLAYANLRHRRNAVEDKLAELVEQRGALLAAAV